MITAFILAGVAAVSPATSEKPARCTVQQVHLPAGKIGPITTIERCKPSHEVARQDVQPPLAKPSAADSN